MVGPCAPSGKCVDSRGAGLAYWVMRVLANHDSLGEEEDMQIDPRFPTHVGIDALRVAASIVSTRIALAC